MPSRVGVGVGMRIEGFGLQIHHCQRGRVQIGHGEVLDWGLLPPIRCLIVQIGLV